MNISFQYCQFLLANKIICQEDQIYISSLWVWNRVNIESLQWFLVMKTSLANLRLNWNSCCLFLSPPTGHPGHHTKQGNWPWRDCGAHLWEDRCEGWRWAFSSVHTGALTCLLTIGTCATQVKWSVDHLVAVATNTVCLKKEARQLTDSRKSLQTSWFTESFQMQLLLSECDGWPLTPTGELTLEEFIEGAKEHPDITEMLKNLMDLTPVLEIIVKGRENKIKDWACSERPNSAPRSQTDVFWPPSSCLLLNKLWTFRRQNKLSSKPPLRILFSIWLLVFCLDIPFRSMNINTQIQHLS